MLPTTTNFGVSLSAIIISVTLLVLSMAAVVGMTPRVSKAETPADAIARIRRGPHMQMPPPQTAYASGPAGKGMTIENGTNYLLRVHFSGPMNHTVEVPDGHSVGVELVVGSYEVAAEVVDETWQSQGQVVPFEVKEEPVLTADGHFTFTLHTKDTQWQETPMVCTLRLVEGRKVSFKSKVQPGGEVSFTAEGLPQREKDTAVPWEFLHLYLVVPKVA